MSSRSKRKKRILIVLGCLVLLGLGIAGAYIVRQSQLDARARTSRDAGREALAKGDWSGALEGYGRYLQRYMGRGATAEDFVAYAKARRHIESPNGVHLTDSIAILRNAVELDPACAEARKDLLALYLETGYATEALDLAATMLRDAPDDPYLLQVRCEIFEQQRRFGEALEVARRLNALSPQDLQGHFRTLRLLLAGETPASEIDDWLGAVTLAHKSDQRYELLRAAVLARRHDENGAKASLDRALAAAPGSNDPKFIRLLVDQLDSARRFDDSMRVLETHATGSERALMIDLVRRLWYSGRPAELLARIGASGAVGTDEDPEALALRVLALTVTGRGADASAPREALAARTDKAGAAWAAYVGRIVDGSLGKPGSIAALTAASAAVPQSALIRQALGDAYSSVGENDLALDAWTTAASLAPSWAGPLRSISNTLVRTGEEHIAQAVAHEAMMRSPNDIETITTYLRATAAVASEMSGQQLESLLSAVKMLEHDVPEQSDEALPLYVGLLARVDKAAAEARLRQALASTTRATESTLLRLAQIAAQVGTTLEGRFLDLSESIYGVTPQLALARAIARARSAGEESGLRLIDELRSRPNSALPVEWDLVRASFIDAIRRADSGRVWIAVAKQYPDELRAQLGALSSVAAWKERVEIEPVIERVRALTGDDGVTWRIARARWLLQDPSVSDSSVAAAAKILSDVTRAAPRSTTAHVLLAQSLERLGNLAGAEEQLRTASQIAPSNTWIGLEVARLAQRQDRPDVARRQLEQVLSSPDLIPEQLERAAYLLAVQGDVRRSADLLEPLISKAQARRDGAILLARLYVKLGQPERALSLCQRLVNDPDPDVIELTASIYASLGRTAEAEVALARLDSLAGRPGERELQRAKFSASWGSVDAARSWYRRSVAAAPDREDAWTAWVSHAIVTGDAESFGSILSDAKALCAEPVRYLVSVRSACEPALRSVRLRSLVLAMVEDTADRPVLLSAIELASKEIDDASKRLDWTRQIAALAEANVRTLPLQLLAADVCADEGLFRRACEIATRAMTEFPNSPAAARAAAECLARAGRWKETIPAALSWRDKAAGRPYAPDLLIAEAQLRCGRPADAAARLEPYVADARARPADKDDLLVAYAVALTRTARAAEAARLLHETCGQSDHCRALAVGVESERLGDAGSAAAWFGVVEPLGRSDDAKHRLLVARAWAGAWERFGAKELLSGARSRIDELRNATELLPETLALSGSLAHQAGDLGAARRDYEAALARSPGLIAVRNNLAVVLTEQGDWSRGVAEATKAVNAAPRSPECLDTLAEAYRRGGDLSSAASTFRRAIEVQPANPAWRLRLAEVLAVDGKTAESAKVADQIDELVGLSGELAEADRSRLETLRARPR